ncbi:hypothetical protein SAMN05421805_102179 [Saccharopolyspora antimicrobica]|uniref:Uncharacterized protein n=1 Tax=Saccharopolyspora antimicrobica TaxID=455193 RepID=A0A1I4VFL3_9PSEU|nr:hypothetical protein [Saccharopolyspora antimicrobica]RKT86283.1 hypothetical protein ATL45_4645 [Saccharopolyspora antimicrobica]SFN00027.1 hypothetical protein SAMN05421805_102179 [Saccharopolyspora antimicrobica]
MRNPLLTPLPEFLVRASAVLEDLANDVRERTVRDEQYTEAARLLDELAELLRDRSATYVPPRVVDGERASR